MNTTNDRRRVTRIKRKNGKITIKHEVPNDGPRKADEHTTKSQLAPRKAFNECFADCAEHVREILPVRFPDDVRLVVDDVDFRRGDGGSCTGARFFAEAYTSEDDAIRIETDKEATVSAQCLITLNKLAAAALDYVDGNHGEPDLFSSLDDLDGEEDEGEDEVDVAADGSGDMPVDPEIDAEANAPETRGERAALAGGTLDDNPYDPFEETAKYERWEDGFESVEREATGAVVASVAEEEEA
jgi:hypothetical protein